MTLKLAISCLSLFSATTVFAAVNPAYVGVGVDQATLESGLKANGTVDPSVTCKDVIFVRISGSTSVVLGGLCTVKGHAPQMACLNASSKKVALADRSFPELTFESELRSHMTDACGLN